MSRGFLVDSLFFSSSRYVLLGLSAVRNIVVARMLGPGDYGYWVIFSVILTYGDQLHLGLRHAGDKEIPFLNGRGEPVQAERAANAVYGAVLALAAIGVLLASGVAMSSVFNAPQLRAVIVGASLILFSEQVNRFFLMVLRTQKEFVLSSKVETVFEFVRTLSVCGLAMVLKMEGAIGGMLLASVSTTLYFVSRFRHRFSPRLDVVLTKRLFVIGFPLFLSGVLYIAMISLDRVVGTFVLSKQDLGLYGVASLLAQLPISASLATTAVLYPRFSESFGQSGDIRSLYPLYAEALVMTSYLSPLLVATVFFAAELLIGWLLPAFQGAVGIMGILTNGVYFLAIVPLPMYLLMATGRNREYISAQSYAVAVGLVLYLILGVGFSGPRAVAVAASLSYLTFLVLMYFRASGAFALARMQAARELGAMMLPAVYSIAVVLLLSRLITLSVPTVAEHLRVAFLKLSGFFILYVPMLFILNRRTRFLVRSKKVFWHGD